MQSNTPLFPIVSSSTEPSAEPQTHFPIAESCSSAPETSSQLFPISQKTSSELATVQDTSIWLSFSSFSADLIPAPTPIPEWYLDSVKSEEHEEPVRHHNYELLKDSPCDEDNNLDFNRAESDENDRNREEKRKRGRDKRHHHERRKDKKKKKSDSESKGDNHRSKERRWIDMDKKDYQFDARGDRDNLAYGSLYRMDVPRFYRHQIRIIQNKPEKFLHNLSGLIFQEQDGAAMEDKLKAEGRYWSAKHASLEKRKDIKRLQILPDSIKFKAQKPFCVPNADFIPLDLWGAEEEEVETNHIFREESWDDYVIRKTKEFNQLTRERPHDESLWISFAKFQDEQIKGVSKKAVIQRIIEKKIAVIEKALEIHPFSEELWLLFLDTCRKKDPASVMLSKWETSIKRNPRSYKLWREYLCFVKGEFSLFTVSSIRKAYIHAIQAYLSAHYVKDYTDNCNEDNEVEKEKNLVSMFIDLCIFEWQTGHHELAIGLLQAQIEYSMFPPPILVSEKTKKRLFKEFWDSGDPRVGEDGSIGWQGWLQQEEQRIQSAALKNDVGMDMEEETGGWTGWFEPSKKNSTLEDEAVPSENVGETKEIEEVKETEENDMEEDSEDEVKLLERLGLDLGSGQDLEIKDTAIWRRWSEVEKSRDSAQWLPLRAKNLKAVDDEEILPEAEEEDEQLERTVLFEDIQDCLFSLKTVEGELELIFRFTDFCIGPLPEWCCSNSLKWKERIESLEHLFGPLLEELESSSVECGVGFKGFKDLMEGLDWMREGESRSHFLANALLLLRPFFQNHLCLQQKLLDVEAYRNSGGPRVLAKKLLKNDRQAVLLWGAYGRAEASAGNLEAARKVFDATLATLSSLPEDIQKYASILYQCYAEIELSQFPDGVRIESKTDVHQKVLYMLSCLGSGIPYAPFKVNNQNMGTQILRAKHGFKEQLQNARNQCLKGDVTDDITALIKCAALFELLVDGYEAAGSVYEESFTMSLPGKRERSIHFELLYCDYILMLEQHKQHIKPSALRGIITRALTQYPNNHRLLGAFIRSSSHSACVNKLRRFLDVLLEKSPSTILWLFAISVELRRPGARSRIHSLFEKALETSRTQQSVVLWRSYIAFELYVRGDADAARRIYFRAIHSCPWSKALWLDGFEKMSSILSAKELSDFQDIMREKELRLRTDVYEILLEKEEADEQI